MFYNLQMINLQMQYGARYGCLNVGDSSRAFAYVISLGMFTLSRIVKYLF